MLNKVRSQMQISSLNEPLSPVVVSSNAVNNVQQDFDQNITTYNPDKYNIHSSNKSPDSQLHNSSYIPISNGSSQFNQFRYFSIRNGKIIDPNGWLAQALMSQPYVEAPLAEFVLNIEGSEVKPCLYLAAFNASLVGLTQKNWSGGKGEIINSAMYKNGISIGNADVDSEVKSITLLAPAVSVTQA